MELFEIELIIHIKMDLALNKLQTNQPTNQYPLDDKFFFHINKHLVCSSG